MQVYNITASTSSGASAIFTPLLNMMFGLLVPYCGYVGAKRKDRNLLCCFCGCNFCAAACFLLFTLAYTGFVLSVIDSLLEDCDEDGSDNNLPEWAQASP